jgi:hypothetical protein
LLRQCGQSVVSGLHLALQLAAFLLLLLHSCLNRCNLTGKVCQLRLQLQDAVNAAGCCERG